MKPAIFLLVVAGALFLSSPAVEAQNLFGILRYMLTPHYYTHHHHHRHFHHHHGILSATLLWDQNFPLYGNWQMLADDAHTSSEVCDQETSEFKFGFAHQNSGYVITHGGHHQDWGEYKPMAVKQIPHGWAITFAGTNGGEGVESSVRGKLTITADRGRTNLLSEQWILTEQNEGQKTATVLKNPKKFASRLVKCLPAKLSPVVGGCVEVNDEDNPVVTLSGHITDHYKPPKDSELHVDVGPYLKLDIPLQASVGSGCTYWDTIAINDFRLQPIDLASFSNRHVTVVGKLVRFGSTLVDPPIFLDIKNIESKP